MMPAAKHFDPVLGVDIHIIQPPGPVPPVPIPHPFVGFLIDPMDYVPIIGATVKVNGIPRAQAGTAGKCVPSHIPIGGVFVKPPANECEMFMGSSTVAVDGDAFSYLALPALSCHDIGMPPIPRFKKKSKIKSMLLPTTVVLPIPAGPPVLVGGPPTISLMALGMKLGMSALGAAFKKLKKTALFKKAMNKLKQAKNKLFSKLKPGFLKCKVLKAEPVDITTGEVVVEQQDFELSWPLLLRWTRRYRSHSTRAGLCGHGWETPADARLVFESDGTVLFYDGNPGNTFFPKVPTRDEVREFVDGAVLSQTNNHYTVRLKSGESYYFTKPARPVEEILVDRIIDLRGRAVIFTRDAGGLREILSDVGIRVEAVSRNGRVEQLTLVHPNDPEPHILTRYEYDESGDLRAVYDALGSPYLFEYANHCLIRHTDRNRLSFYYDFDEFTPEGRVVRSWGDGGLYDYKFAYNLDEVQVTDSLGSTSTIQLDDRDLPISETDSLGGTTLFEYDERGRGTGVVDPSGLRTEYQYDDRGNLLSVVRPDGKSITTQYDDNNRRVAITDFEGNVWRQEWNDRGLLVRQFHPNGAVATYEYDDRGQLTASKSPRGGTTRVASDRFGRVTSLTDGMGNRTILERDVHGRVTAKLDPLGRRIVYRYDARGLLTGVDSPRGSTEHAYDGQGNLTTFKDEEGFSTTLRYVGLGELAEKHYADGTSVKYKYDTEERLVSITNQRGEIYQFRRDPIGRVVEEVDYWGQARRYKYGGSGYLESSEDALGRVVRYTTDALGRVVSKFLPDGSVETFAYDGNGNLVQASNQHISVERRFDAAGRVVEESQGAFTIKNEYDLEGNRTKRSTSLGNTITYEYDFLGQVVAIRINQVPAARIERNAAGQVIREVVGLELHKDLAYNSSGLRTGLQVSGRAGSIIERQYAYDRRGDLVHRGNSTYGLDLFSYDPLHRLTRHEDPLGRLWQYEYDPAGDLLHPSDKPSGGGGWERLATSRDIVCVFDAAGNMTSRRQGTSTVAFAWDADNRLAHSQKNGRVATDYGYDPQGRRIFKRTQGISTRFYWDGDALIADHLPDQKAREIIHYPGSYEPLAMVDPNGEIYYFHNDPNGLPRELISSWGVVVWSAAYTAFGATTELRIANIDQPLRLPGQYFDQETGLHYNRFRYFDAATNSLLSQDPLGVRAGENVYRFVPNVWAWADPLGLTCTWVPASSEHALDRHSPHRPAGPGGKGTEFPSAWSEEEFLKAVEEKANDPSVIRTPVPAERGGVGWTQQTPVTINGETRTVRIIGEVPDPAIPGTGPGVITSAYPPWKNR
jgi:RHS repeat-associated protein